MPVAPANETPDLASSAASGSASSTCAPATRADTPACTGAPLWVPGGPLYGLWPAELAGLSTSAGDSTPAPIDWQELARRNHEMLEDDAARAHLRRSCTRRPGARVSTPRWVLPVEPHGT